MRLLTTINATHKSQVEDKILLAYTNRDYPLAFKLALPAARAGSFLAQIILGYMHGDGNGVPESISESVYWLLLAAGPSHAKSTAEEGDPHDQYAAGLMYQGGWIFPKDDARALTYYRRAAEQG